MNHDNDFEAQIRPSALAPIMSISLLPHAKNKHTAVVRCLAEVKWLVMGNDYPVMVYTDHEVLKSILTKGSENSMRISIPKSQEEDNLTHREPCWLIRAACIETTFFTFYRSFRRHSRVEKKSKKAGGMRKRKGTRRQGVRGTNPSASAKAASSSSMINSE